jgi:hypothetical protein
MTAKHTQGPWVVQKYVGSDLFKVHAFGMESNGWQPKELPIALIPNGWYRGDPALHNELEANARLIAAAPELLKALAMAVMQNDHDMLMTGEELREAHEALAKALGDAA